jgi:hypothetical protein
MQKKKKNKKKKIVLSNWKPQIITPNAYDSPPHLSPANTFQKEKQESCIRVRQKSGVDTGLFFLK